MGAVKNAAHDELEAALRAIEDGEVEYVIDQADFLAWARTMPPEKEFNYINGHACALCHFFHHHGVAFSAVGGVSWWGPRWELHIIPSAIAEALCAGTRTYGALAQRLSGDAQ